MAGLSRAPYQHKPGCGFLYNGYRRAEFYKDTSPLPGEEIIIKHKPDSFLGTTLKEKLAAAGTDKLVVCGMMTHMCIDTTVRSAAAHGYSVTLIEDACATSDLEWRGTEITADRVHNAYMAALDGSFAEVMTADEWIGSQQSERRKLLMDINVLLFPDFETLDAFGPVEILSRIDGYRLRFISMDGGVIRSKQGTDILTEPASEADHSGILLVPGGQGTRLLVNDPIFIEKLKQIASRSIYCLTVCTGSALLAKTGLLDGRKATSNKRAFDWVKSVSSNVDWMPCARWVADGKFYTSSGISAGMDMSLGFINDRFGKEIADETASAIEYVWNCDKDCDPFAR